jgi:nitrogen fixation protein FixH
VTPARRWAAAIVGLLAANAAAAGVLLVSANAGESQVIPSYYERAARYDDEIEAAARSRALGWRVEVAAAGGALAVEVRDAAGGPVTGARVRVSGHHRAHAARRYELAAAAVGPGRYSAPAPAPAGRHDVAIEIERGEERFVRRAVVEVR